MPNTVTTPYMDLVLPVPSVELGPQWAQELNAALDLVDAHDHTSGKGLQVPSAGINIDADLSFGSFNATALRSARFTSQSSNLSLPADIDCLYVKSGDLWYNNSAGNQIQLTSGTVIDSPYTLDNVTLVSSSNVASVAPVNYVLSNSCGSANTTSGSFTPVPSFSNIITTHGRPVELRFIDDGAALTGSVISAANFAQITFQVTRVNTFGTPVPVDICNTYFLINTSPGGIPSSSFYFMDFPAAGSWTYTVYYKVSGGTNGGISNSKFLTREII